MYYDYVCNKCLKKLERRSRRSKHQITQKEFDELVLFETSHSIDPTEDELIEATTCPRCASTDCVKYFANNNVIGYVRGNGYLDKAGVKRDITLHTLVNDDPYAQYRVPGEADDLATRLRRGGKHDPKRKHFTPVGEMEAAVTKAAAQPPIE